MKVLRILVLLLMITLISAPTFAAYEGEDDAPGPYDLEPPEKRSGWYMGTDQGILFFVGNSSNFVNAQYYGTLHGGYNFKGYISPMFRFSQAIGSLAGFFNPTTYFFIFEGGFRATPLRTKFRPFFVGTAGVYILTFSQFASPVQTGANFTFSGGGGAEYSFGNNTIDITGAYRGFLNAGPYLEGVEVTLGYTWKF